MHLHTILTRGLNAVTLTQTQINNYILDRVVFIEQIVGVN